MYHFKITLRIAIALVLTCSSMVGSSTLFAQEAGNVLFIRGADRSGGFLEANNDAERTEQLADIFNQSTSGGNHGWFELAQTLLDNGFSVEQMIEPLEAGAPSSGQTTGAPIPFDTLDLNPYDVIVFGSNNAAYTSSQVDAVEDYLRGGGGAIFISDANFGSDWADASNSDQPFLSRFGLTARQDRGTYSITSGEFVDPSHPILENINAFDGEGVTPINVGSTLPAGVEVSILAVAEGTMRINEPPFGNQNQGSVTTPGSQDAALLAATIDEGRLVGHFDRNTFFNLNGAGTNINRFDNEQFALNLFTWAANVPEPSTAISLIAASCILLIRRRSL